jgi:RND family efflux transporter MFP subunit
MNAAVDLRQLAVTRDEAPLALTRAAGRRRVLSRFLLPGIVLFGFLAVLGWAARDSLAPARPVTVVPVMPATGEEQERAGQPLFQAAGWVEPRPTPVVVTALAEGAVEQLLVVEGQEVRSGEPVARLIAADAQLALEAAEAEKQLRDAELAGARAVRDSARVNVSQPVQLQAALAEAEAMLAKTETELANLPHQLRAAEARRKLAQIDLDNRQRASGSSAISEISIRQAESELEASKASADELKAREPRLKREAEALRRRCDALCTRLELKTDETRALAEAEANVKTGEAKVEQARVAVAAARLRLERMTVRAPANGRVLALVARPGTRLMGLAQGTFQESSTVVTLYDPASLQVRADVRFENVPQVRPGQPARIETPAAPGGALEGEVLFATAISDIQKNTLQVKVAIKSPPPTLKPDMLVQVTFLAPPEAANAAGQAAVPRFLLPRTLVETAEGNDYVWIADQASGVARRRVVKLGPVAGDLVTVVEGLNASDKAIVSGRDGLRDGERIRVTGEDATFGVAGRGAAPSSERIVRTPPPAKK